MAESFLMGAKTAFLALLVMGTVSGCAVFSGEETETLPDADVPGRTVTERIGVLPPQDFGQDGCGLFLWAPSERARLVFASNSRSGVARMVLDGQQVTLPRAEARGRAMFGHFPKQSFAYGTANVSIDLTFEPRGDLVGGVIIRRGLLKLEDPDADDHVVPIAGMVACQGQ